MNERTQHTPGPWFAEFPGNAVFSASETERGIQGATNPKQVAAAIGEGNARLIAAAPSMYQWLTAHYACEEGPGRTDRPQYEELRRILASVTASVANPTDQGETP